VILNRRDKIIAKYAENRMNFNIVTIPVFKMTDKVDKVDRCIFAGIKSASFFCFLY